MNFKCVLAPLPVTALRAGSVLSVAAGSYRSTSPRAVMHDPSMMGNQMMSDRMMGVSMIHDRPMMIGRLPSTSEKLVTQMHGEMLTAMGQHHAQVRRQDRTGTVEMITRLVDASRLDPLQSQGVTP